MVTARHRTSVPAARLGASPRILQCDSKGDQRFSPFFCWVEAFGVRDTIEEHYQKAKIFVRPNGELVFPANWREAKAFGRLDYLKRWCEIRLPNGQFVPDRFLVFGWYASLWLKYLDEHAELVAIARTYDDYHDRFKGDFPLCQADCIRLFVKQGRPALLAHCKEFFTYLRSAHHDVA